MADFNSSKFNRTAFNITAEEGQEYQEILAVDNVISVNVTDKGQYVDEITVQDIGSVDIIEDYQPAGENYSETLSVTAVNNVSEIDILSAVEELNTKELSKVILSDSKHTSEQLNITDISLVSIDELYRINIGPLESSASSEFTTGLITNITVNMQGVSGGLIDVLYDYQFKVDFSSASKLSVSLESGLNLETNIQSSFDIIPSSTFFISGQSNVDFSIYPKINIVIDSSSNSGFEAILTFVSDSELLLVLNPDLEIVSYLEDYTDFVWNRKWREPDDFELTISKKKNAARYLVTDNYIAKKRGDLMHAGRIKRRRVEKEGRAESLTVSGIGLGEIFKNRIAFHEVNTGDGYDTQSGSAESVMKHYIDVNVINPENEDRAVSNLTLEKDKSRGQTINYRARFQKISEILYEISKTTGLGWDVILDLKNKEFVFKVLTAKIRTGVRLNPDMDSVSLINYEEDKSEQENTILIGGQGQGADRTLKEVNVSDL